MIGGGPTRYPHTCTLERIRMELGGKLLENQQMDQELGGQMHHARPNLRWQDVSSSSY